jgi:hypothetical protein
MTVCGVSNTIPNVPWNIIKERGKEIQSENAGKILSP